MCFNPSLARRPARFVYTHESRDEMSKRTCVTIAGVLAALSLVAVLAGGALAAGTVNAKAKLNEKQVVPGPGAPKATGSATFEITKSKLKFCYDISFKKLNPAPNSAELHKGAKGDKGPKKFDLWTKTTNSPASACIKNLKKPVLNKIVNHPENFYVQLHSTKYPKGAIRGQLKAAKSSS